MSNVSPLEEWRESQRRLRRRWLSCGTGGAVVLLGFLLFARLDRRDARIAVVTVLAIIGGLYVFAITVAIVAGPADRQKEPSGWWGGVVEWCSSVFWLP